MNIRVGINGFGRMGRLALRTAWDWPEFDIVHINEIKGGPETAAHLLEFDSVHGPWHRGIRATDRQVIIDGKAVGFSDKKSPGEVAWKDLGIDVVIEASGKFRTQETLQPYFDQGVAKVIVAAPVKAGALNMVMGVNDDLYQPAKHHLVTAASCTTNCLAPLVQPLHQAIGVEHGLMTTIHAYTNDQVLTDVFHSDLRRARSATMSMIPTKTGAAAAVGLVLPELAGKLDGFAIRVPTINVSMVDLTFRAARDTSTEEIDQVLEEASKGALKDILGFNREPLVSIDFNHDPRSSIYESSLTRVVDSRLVKVCSWYDNEWGFSTRMLDATIALMNAG